MNIIKLVNYYNIFFLLIIYISTKLLGLTIITNELEVFYCHDTKINENVTASVK